MELKRFLKNSGTEKFKKYLDFVEPISLVSNYLNFLSIKIPNFIPLFLWNRN